MIRRKILRNYRYLFFPVAIAACAQSVSAAPTPAGTFKERIKTGTPRKDGINTFTCTVSWKSDGNTKQSAKGVANIKGPDQKEPDTATTKAAKIAAAIQAAINEFEEASRGARADQTKAGGSGLPEVVIQNITGFKDLKIKCNDKTNELEKIETIAHNAGIDFFGTPTGGTVAVTVGEGTPVVITTDGLTTAQIEAQIVAGLDLQGIESSISTSPLLPDLEDPSEPFDGSEIQLLDQRGTSFTIDVDDDGLGVIFETELMAPAIPTVSEWGLMAMALLVLAAGTVVLIRRRGAVVGSGM